MNIQYIHPADQLVMFMQRIYDKGLTTMSGGNLSIRDTQGNIWITPAGIDKGTLCLLYTSLLNQSFLTVFIPSLGWPTYHL